MFCPQCKKGVLIRQYKITNQMFSKEKYFNSLEQAEDYYEVATKTYPYMEWELTELLICNDCNYVNKTVLKGEKV